MKSKIAYHKVSGKIGLSNHETGKKGMWVEKRVAFLNFLQEKHTFDILTKTTPPTQRLGYSQKITNEKYDTLILEFGGTNMLFYERDWDFTFYLIKKHKGQIIFLCDDPDLMFPFKKIDEDYSRWTILLNTPTPQLCRDILHIPDKAEILDYPFHHGMHKMGITTPKNKKIIYMGSLKNRKSQAFLLDSKHITSITEKQDTPHQFQRYNYYRNFFASLCLYDKKHEKTNWRTGRAYHALSAGIPTLAMEGSIGLGWCYPVSTLRDIDEFTKLTIPERRKKFKFQSSITKVKKESLQQIPF